MLNSKKAVMETTQWKDTHTHTHDLQAEKLFITLYIVHRPSFIVKNICLVKVS